MALYKTTSSGICYFSMESLYRKTNLKFGTNFDDSNIFSNWYPQRLKPATIFCWLKNLSTGYDRIFRIDKLSATMKISRFWTLPTKTPPLETGFWSLDTHTIWGKGTKFGGRPLSIVDYIFRTDSSICSRIFSVCQLKLCLGLGLVLMSKAKDRNKPFWTTVTDSIPKCQEVVF